MSNRSLFAIVLLCCGGCMSWDAGYTQNMPVSRRNVPSLERFPVSYSVTLDCERDDLVAQPDQRELMRKAEEALKATGLFSDVSPGAAGEDSYHVDFRFRQSGMDAGESSSVEALSLLTLFLVPTGDVVTFDGTAVLSLEGKPIYSTAKAEEIRCLYWLPAMLPGIFMNPWTAWDGAEDGSVNALVEDIADFHVGKFLSPQAMPGNEKESMK